MFMILPFIVAILGFASLIGAVYWSALERLPGIPDPEDSIDAEFHNIVAPFGDESWCYQIKGRIGLRGEP